MNFKLILALALVIRLLLVFTAHHGDLNNNISWGNLSLERGLVNFYEHEWWPHSAPNQPPLTILLFSFTSFAWQFINSTSWWLNNNLSIFPSSFIWFWETRGMDLLVKIPSIIADLILGVVIFRHFKDSKKALFISGLWLFNPVSIYNSAIWGQTDAIVNLFGALAILGLLKKKLSKFSFWITISFLFKGSLGIFAPVLLVTTLWQKHSLKDWIRSALLSIAVVAVISIWFHPYLDLPIWLINLYKDRILPGEIGFLTANAFNLWWLVDPGRILDSTTYFGLSAKTLGYLTVLPLIFLIIIKLKKVKSSGAILLALALSSFTAFLFLTRIHERYLFPFFAIGVFAIKYYPKLALLFIILSFAHILNLYHLFWAPPFPFLEKLYLNPNFANSLSLLNLFLYILLLAAFMRAPKLKSV